MGFIHFAETDMLAAVRQKASLHKSNLTTPSARTSSTTFISPFPHDTKKIIIIIIISDRPQNPRLNFSTGSKGWIFLDFIISMT